MKNTFVYEEIRTHNLREPYFDVLSSESYAQCAEDLLVLAIMKAYSFKHNISMDKFSYIEIGANHPIATSSTYLFYKNYGMTGVLVEANPTLISDLQRIRNKDIIISAAVVGQDIETIKLIIPEANELATTDTEFLSAWRGEGSILASEYTVDAIHINTLFDKYFKNIPPFYLSLDIEGKDIEVLKQIDFTKNRPFVLQVEPSEHYNANASVEIDEILSKENYSLFLKTDVNLIYIDDSNYFLKCLA